MRAKWELAHLFIAGRHSTSKVPATNLQLGQGSEGQQRCPCSVSGLGLGRLRLLGAGTPECPHTFLSLCLWSHHLSSPVMGVGCLGWLWCSWLPRYMSPGRSSIVYCNCTSEVTSFTPIIFYQPRWVHRRSQFEGEETQTHLSVEDSRCHEERKSESGILLVCYHWNIKSVTDVCDQLDHFRPVRKVYNNQCV